MKTTKLQFCRYGGWDNSVYVDYDDVPRYNRLDYDYRLIDESGEVVACYPKEKASTCAAPAIRNDNNDDCARLSTGKVVRPGDIDRLEKDAWENRRQRDEKERECEQLRLEVDRLCDKNEQLRQKLRLVQCVIGDESTWA